MSFFTTLPSPHPHPHLRERENPTHAVLTNPDILELILENLSVDRVWELESEEVVLRRSVLASTALTCRTFMEPALDRLWRSLDKLFPLFKLLPAFYRSDSTFVLRGRISESDWDRFDWYARRVKSFCYSRDPDSLDIAMHVYFRIAQLRRLPLLPSLRHLKCPHISQDDFLISSICLFLTPSLSELNFEKITGVEDKLIGTFLHTLICEEARIERLELVGEGLTKDTLMYIGRLMSLKSLIVNGMGRYVDLEVVKSLGRIPGLEELELDLEESGLLSEGEELGFKELTKLEVVAPLSFIKALVLSIGTTQLKRIGLEGSTTDEVGIVDRKDLLGTLVRKWKNTLTYIRMVHTTEPGSDDETTIPASTRISMNTISPLLELSNLRHLELDGYALEVGDANITEMAESWPNIETLHLPFMGSGIRRPTVISLQTLSRQCPALRSLTIPLDTADFTMLHDTTVSVHRLRVLTVAGPDEPWERRRETRLAPAMDRLFPYLERVAGHVESREVERWQHVEELVKMCQSVRREAVQNQMYHNPV
ncbi:hypothetical protein AGABI2DRAFT_209334 [Agaricus bisporus var. bisporus H97]|uniref:hypothetical protein n=1 Tax=Agaricus bisporus var. bisporus (strain H97 / ATCC MYA-4626 / FGSC 10389) TaxID=936046 RepID=UPI00029F64ED|nr:hypothetical protein AGABI2DRAFT_209334 [Agaricus bisporus var. bisporus H97]EKV43804.1 hypothetical protein AGABI2DRAFT_209334 [Agaricus bisporus var. bisporus H97]